jgi:hypothetical protein
MNTLRHTALASLLVVVPLLAACNANERAAEAEVAKVEKSVISDAIHDAIAEAKKEIDHGNISLSDDGKPKAEITPQGDLLIAGKKVAVTAAQRAVLADYRAQVEGVAEAGMEIGAQGADLATKAVGEALRGVFTGNTDQVEQRVEAEAEKIKASARKLCDRLPALLAAQQKAAATVPEFAPYATMDQKDVDECMEDHDLKIAAKAPKQG